jgi:septal ring factor EnvC (AmiA/AmiB activator)
MAVIWTVPAGAASDKAAGGKKAGQRLEEVKRALGEGREKAQQLKKKALTIEQELAKLRRDMVAAAHIIQEQERRATGLVKTLVELRAEEEAKLAQLAARRGQLAGILVALQRVARYPPEALMTQPMPPADTVRSAILLRAAVPEIEGRAQQLRGDLEALSKARREMADKNRQLANITASLEKEHKRLAVLFGQKTVIKHRTLAERRAEARRMKSLVGEAATLRDLLNQLNKSRRPGPRPKRPGAETTPPPGAGKTVAGLPSGLTGAPISGQRGKLPPPAVGRIVGRYGQTTRTGLTKKGITLQTAPGAQVVAPYEGRVVYAGKFRGYGELLIIEHGEGYHSLLSGLVRIDSTMGQWVVAGEPIGVMGRPDNAKPVLYVELRRNGQPINPLPWLSAQR